LVFQPLLTSIYFYLFFLAIILTPFIVIFVPFGSPDRLLTSSCILYPFIKDLKNLKIGEILKKLKIEKVEKEEEEYKVE
jgi:hypothetical protein